MFLSSVEKPNTMDEYVRRTRPLDYDSGGDTAFVAFTAVPYVYMGSEVANFVFILGAN